MDAAGMVMEPLLRVIVAAVAHQTLGDLMNACNITRAVKAVQLKRSARHERSLGMVDGNI